MPFAQEMKDFLGAAQAGQKIMASRTDSEYKESMTDALRKKTERDNDPETLANADKKAQADLKLVNANIGAVGARSAYTGALTKRINSVPSGNEPASSGLLPPGMGGAVPTGPAPAGVASPGLSNTMQIDDDPAFADGGMVPEQPPEEDPEDTPDDQRAAPSAVDTGTAAPRAAPTDVSAQSRQSRGLDGVVAPGLIHDAVRGGMNYGIKEFGLDRRAGGIQTAQQRNAAQKLVTGYGGMTEQEMAAAKKAVDPDGKMTDGQRNMAALGAVYQFQIGKGNVEGAQRIAFGMLQHYRVAAQRYAGIAAEAAKGGNMDLATKAAMKAYANVPDGKDFHVEPSPDDPKKLIYYYTDEKGNEIAKGIVTPEALAASAMGLASGGFDKAILQAAGQRDAKATGRGAGAVDPNAMPKRSAAIDNKRIEGLDELHKNELDATQKSLEDPKSPASIAAAKSGKVPDTNELDDIKDAASHLLQDNGRATPREAWKASKALLTFDKNKPDEQPFKVISSGEDGYHTLKVGSMKMRVDDDQLEEIMNRRAKLAQANDARIDQEMQAGDKKTYGQRFSELAGNVGDAASAAIPDELKTRGKSAIDAVKRRAVDTYNDVAGSDYDTMMGGAANATGEAIRRGGNALRNPGNVPAVDISN